MTNEKHGVLQFIGVACLIFCVLFLIFSFPFFWKQFQVLRSWPVAQAQVLRSEVVTQAAPDHGQFYTVELQLRYTVDGKPITAELISFQSKNYQETETRSAEFPVGSLREARYDPHDPAQARIGAGWNARFFAVPLLLLGMGAVFVIIAVALFLAAR
jgi:hypothetical protein